MTTQTIHCECGEITGQSCQHEIAPGEGVRFSYLPEWLRGTAEACGSYRGMTQTVIIHPDCAAMLDDQD